MDKNIEKDLEYTDLVSVIIPVHNAENFIADTVASVKGQTYPYWELILVDDGSTDGSSSLLKGFEQDERIHIISNSSACGAAQARNAGTAVAKGRYLCFLDADDIWFPEKLETQVKFMHDKCCAFSFTGYEFATADGVGVAKIVTVPESITYRQALKNTTIFTSTVMFDMTKISKELIHMPNVPSEDSATWWQVLKTGIVGRGIKQPMTLYRRSKGTLSSNKLVAIKRIWNLYRNVEHLNIFYSAYCFCFYAVNAVLRRM